MSLDSHIGIHSYAYIIRPVSVIVAVFKTLVQFLFANDHLRN